MFYTLFSRARERDNFFVQFLRVHTEKGIIHLVHTAGKGRTGE